MKTLRITVAAIPRGFEVVRRFGAARLITNHAGRWQLLGGSATDRLNAREWISLFCHEALLEPSASEASGAPPETSLPPDRDRRFLNWSTP